MPHYTVPVGPQGPLLAVFVNATAARRGALLAAGRALPQAVLIQIVVDTGASMTSIDQAVIAQLGLQPTGTVGILTPSTGATPHQCSTYDVELIIPGYAPVKHIPALAVTDGNYSTQGHGGLLGRDALKDARLIYSGHDNAVMLSF
jgi:hypothetical protein